MENQIKGTVLIVQETQQVSDSFKKRQVVIRTDGEYPQDIAVDFTQDKCGLLDKITVGETVTANYNLRGSEYNGRYFVNLQGWKITSETF